MRCPVAAMCRRRPRRLLSVTILRARRRRRYSHQKLELARGAQQIERKTWPLKIHRRFCAYSSPSPFRRTCGRKSAARKASCSATRRRARVRWTRPEQFHVTLKFLGDVPAEQVGALENSVAAVCAASPALRLAARGIGFFPGERKPRVIWAGVADDSGQLAGTAPAVGRSFAVAGTGGKTGALHRPHHAGTIQAGTSRADFKTARTRHRFSRAALWRLAGWCRGNCPQRTHFHRRHAHADRNFSVGRMKADENSF